MNSIRLGLAVALVLGLVCAAQAEDAKKADGVKDKVLGTWEVTEGKGLPVGSKLTFSRDGKLTIVAEKDSLKLTLKRGDEERSHTIKVEKADDKQLVLVGEKGDKLTLKKAPAGKK